MDRREIDLVKRAKLGDADAFGELYSLYYREMILYARCVIGDEDLATDAVQEAALSAYEQIANLKKTESFKAWLFRILLNTCKRSYVKAQRNKSVISLDEYGENGYGVQPVADSPELSSELKDALDRLSYQEKEIVLLSVLGNYRSHEIAQLLDCPAVTVRSKLSRALKKVRSQLEITGKGGECDDEK